MIFYPETLFIRCLLMCQICKKITACLYQIFRRLLFAFFVWNHHIHWWRRKQSSDRLLFWRDPAEFRQGDQAIFQQTIPVQSNFRQQHIDKEKKFTGVGVVWWRRRLLYCIHVKGRGWGWVEGWRGESPQIKKHFPLLLSPLPPRGMPYVLLLLLHRQKLQIIPSPKLQNPAKNSHHRKISHCLLANIFPTINTTPKYIVHYVRKFQVGDLFLPYS